MKAQRQLRRAYILAELIIAMILATLVTTALLAGLVALVHALQPPEFVVGGERLPIAPTFGAFPSAVRLHQSLTSHLADARAVYVFGGRHISLPAGAPPTSVLPLRSRALPAISDFSPGLPMDSKTFYDRYASKLGPFEANGDAEDFTVLVIGTHGSAIATTCLVQVRRHDATLSDGASAAPVVVHEVQLWDDVGAQRYAFGERPDASRGVFVGAVHTWLRYNAGAAGAEEGPVCAIFPDPWIYGGRRQQPDDVPAFSRFSYLIPVSR